MSAMQDGGRPPENVEGRGPVARVILGVACVTGIGLVVYLFVASGLIGGRSGPRTQGTASIGQSSRTAEEPTDPSADPAAGKNAGGSVTGGGEDPAAPLAAEGRSSGFAGGTGRSEGAPTDRTGTGITAPNASLGAGRPSGAGAGQLPQASGQGWDASNSASTRRATLEGPSKSGSLPEEPTTAAGSASVGAAARAAAEGRIPSVQGPLDAHPSNVPARNDAPPPDASPPEAPPNDTPPAGTDPSSDRTPPVVTALRFDPPSVADGGTANLIISASDDLAGVRSVAARISSPSSTATIYREALPSSEPGIYTCTFPIPGNAEAGRWYVAMLYLYDRADNSKILSYSASTVPPGGTVEVSSQDSDTRPPEVRDAWVEKRSVSGGERNLLSIDVVDDVSGVASVSGYFWSRSRSARIRFDAQLDPGTGRWAAQVLVPANADCGEWTIQMLDATDQALNVTRLQGDAAAVARASFDVSSPSCDTEAPVLESLTLSPTTVSNETASEILVTVVVSDQGTGVSSVYADAVGPIATSGQYPRIRVFCNGNPADPAAPWTGRLVIPQYAARGTWKVDHVHLQDGASNARTYQGSDPVLADGVFEVR